MNRGSLLGLLGVAVLAVSGCGGGSAAPVDPIEIVTSSIDSGPAIDLDRSIDPDTGAFAPEDWPSACELVDEATLRSIFPQTENVARHATASQLTLFGFSLGSDSPPESLTIPEAACTTSVGFPQNGLGLDDGNVVVQVTSAIAVAGSEEFVDLNADAAMAGEATDVGGGACTRPSPAVYNCDVGRLIFSINLDMRRTAQYTQADGSDYVVDGEEFTFQGQDPQWDSIVHDKVLVPLVDAALTRTTTPPNE